jgi:hypothetical protein
MEESLGFSFEAAWERDLYQYETRLFIAVMWS